MVPLVSEMESGVAFADAGELVRAARTSPLAKPHPLGEEAAAGLRMPWWKR